jgi:hypothetical protein
MDDLDKFLFQLIQSKPEFLLSILMVMIMPFIMLPMALLSRQTSRSARRRFVKELLDNPAVQERMKDPQLNFSEFIEQMMKGANEVANANPQRVGMLAKINQDITWDVSGIIGLIVTVVLMIMVVSRTYADMPREILAGWTTILGFYFGKAVK